VEQESITESVCFWLMGGRGDRPKLHGILFDTDYS